MLALQAVTPTQLVKEVSGVTLAEARKLVAQVHRGEPVTPTSAIRRSAAERVRAAGSVPTMSVVGEQASQLDRFVKYAIESAGSRFEAVRIPLADPDRFTEARLDASVRRLLMAKHKLGLDRDRYVDELKEYLAIPSTVTPMPRPRRMPGVSPFRFRRRGTRTR